MYENRLRQEIDRRFNGEELRLICADLGLDYDDDLIGQTKDARILSLVQFVLNRGRIEELVAALEQHRPTIDWRASLTEEIPQTQIVGWRDRLQILITQNRAFQAGLGVAALITIIGCIGIIALIAFVSGEDGGPGATSTTARVAENENEVTDLTTPSPPQNTAEITPSPAATNSPTAEPIPDVIIIEFEGAMEQNILLARRIEDDLQQTLDDYGLTDINIRVQTEPISTIADAQDLATEYGSKVVVWGYLDSVGVNVRIFLNDEKETRRVAGTNELPLQDFEDNQSELAFLAQETIPENVSFISLFVVGQLYYQNNRYQDGFNAFNAASVNLPENVIFTNEALVHFFDARQLDYGGSDDLEQIACGYAQAIDTDPDFVPAYVNLAIFLYKNPDIRSVECLGDKNYTGLMAQALALQPESALLRYNDLAFQSRFGYFATDDDVATVEAILADDPSISGAYLLLGRLTALRGEWMTATNSLETAVTLLPDLEEPHFNLGQLYIINGDLDKAESELQLAYSLNPGNDETQMALANVAYQQDNIGEAGRLLEQITPLDAPYEKSAVAYTANLFRSRLAYDEGNIEEAIAIIEQPAKTDNLYYQYDLFVSYLLGYLYREAGDVETADTILRNGVENGLQYQLEIVLRSENITPGLTWNALDVSCYLYELTDLEETDRRDLSNCNGEETLISGRTMSQEEHLDYIYDTLQSFIARRFKNIPDVFIGQG